MFFFVLGVSTKNRFQIRTLVQVLQLSKTIVIGLNNSFWGFALGDGKFQVHSFETLQKANLCVYSKSFFSFRSRLPVKKTNILSQTKYHKFLEFSKSLF